MPLAPPAPVSASRSALQQLLVCPHCRGALRQSAPDQWLCAPCARTYPLVDGVPLLAVPDDATSAVDELGRQTAADYQRNYQELEAAAAYNQAYEAYPLKRWSTRREYALLHRLLGSQPRSRTLLDLPCGGGRLSPAIGAHTDWLLEADIGMGQIHYGRLHRRVDTPRSWFTASAHHLPMRDGAVDGVVCIRLCHHLPEPAERERLVAELLRVASGFVVMTFFDHHSLKNLLRRARRPFNRKPPKNTMTVDEVRALAQRHGAALVAQPALSWIGSGHRYALMVKS